MEYLISDAKIAKMRNYRSQRVLDYIKDQGFDFLFVWDYGNTRYAFDIYPAFHYESANAFHGYLISKTGEVTIFLSDAFEERHPYFPGGLYDPAKAGTIWTVNSEVRSAGSESYLRSVPKRFARLLAEALSEYGGAKRIGVDNFADFRAYQEVQKLVPNTEFVGVGFDLARLRVKKSNEEIELMEESCKIHNKVLWQAMSEAKPGMTDFEMSSRVAQLFALEPSVEKHCLNLTYSYEPGGAMGMIWSPIGRVYKEGEAISSDVGIMTFGGSVTDYGRVRLLGDTSKELWDAYYWHITNYHEIVSKIKPGMRGSDMVQMFIDAHEAKGMPLVMLGHGIGTMMDELPQLNPAHVQEWDPPIEVNTVYCIEPTCVAECPNTGPQLLWQEDQWVMTEDGFRRLAPLSYFDIDDKDLATMK